MRTLMRAGLVAGLVWTSASAHADEALRSQALPLFGRLQAPSVAAKDAAAVAHLAVPHGLDVAAVLHALAGTALVAASASVAVNAAAKAARRPAVRNSSRAGVRASTKAATASSRAVATDSSSNAADATGVTIAAIAIVRLQQPRLRPRMRRRRSVRW